MVQVNLDQIKERVLPVLKEAGVTHSSIFGSYVRGEEKDSSDVDLLINTPEHMGLFEFAGLKQNLEDVLGKKVDLVTFNSIHPLMRDDILREQVQIL